MGWVDSVMQALHGLAAVVWVGGMFLAFVVLRPASQVVEPPARLQLWAGVFSRFFKWVWLAIFLLMVTGYWDWMTRFNAQGDLVYLQLMQWIGWLMAGIFTWLYFVPYLAFRKAVAEQRFPDAAGLLNTKIRPLIATNLTLGSIEILLGAAGAGLF